MLSSKKPKTKTAPKPRRDAFMEFVVDQLSGVDGVVCRAMFGGYGLYRRRAFFGILFRDRLYFKTNEATAAKYAARGMDCFCPSPTKRMKNYREVPGDVVDDAGELRAWALEAIAVAER